LIRRSLFALVLAVAAAFPAAAGLGEARDAVARAREAGARETASYEYYTAKGYLELAEHGERVGDAEQVVRWSRKSVEQALTALRKAVEGAR